jgi:hypothetical protein
MEQSAEEQSVTNDSSYSGWIICLLICLLIIIALILVYYFTRSETTMVITPISEEEHNLPIPEEENNLPIPINPPGPVNPINPPGPINPPIPTNQGNAQITLLSDPRKFYSLDSTDGKVGRNHFGDYMAGNNVLEYGLGRTRDQNGANDLSSYPLTYAAGHPYYNNGSFGYLSGGNWKNYVNKVATPLENYVGNLNNDQTKSKVLVVESKNGVLSPVQITKSCQYKGIVVRHSGILFVQDNDIDIRTEFILIESGGLFQAGSKYTDGSNSNYRFRSKLRIILTNPPEGYNAMGSVCSQYSYMVYAPGVTYADMNDQNKLMSSYMGDPMTTFCNFFGAKCVAVGFNGNYQLFGLVGNPLPYKGTWGALNLDDNTEFVNEKTLLTYFDGNNADERKNAKIANVEVEYPNTWCRLAEGNYLKGSNQIKIDEKDIGNDCLNEWRPGYQIVITCRTENYTSQKDWLGMVPIWVDNKDNFNYNKNLVENTKFINDWAKQGVNKNSGVEVATIASINIKDGTITLQKPLQFNHFSTKIILDRSAVSTLKPVRIKIDTNLHVGLLTRNILITSEFSDQKDDPPGCNVWKVRPKYKVPKDIPSTIPSEENQPMPRPQPQPVPQPAPQPIIAGKLINTKGCKNPGASFNSAWDTKTGCLTKKWPAEFPNNCKSVPRFLQDPKNGNYDPCTKNFDTCQWYCDESNTCSNNGLYASGNISSCTNSVESFDTMSSSDPDPSSEEWSGPGGAIYCNYTNPSKNKSPATDVYNACYKPRTTGEDIDSKYCDGQKPKVPDNGHWIYGSAHLQGCNSIFGGHQMFMYGSSVCLDGVEIKYMGTPANFGSIGRYPIHFHLSGFANAFKAYLPKNGNYGTIKTNDVNDNTYCREGDIRNCSIWCSFSRWVTLHGCHEINVKNNVGFIALGSGYFIEDGTELNNTFEHNAAICCLTASQHDYWNPLPIYANVSSDLAPTSAFWYKNNQNRCFRNLACNSPAPIIAVWSVPQDIARLRGPSTVCIGDEVLQLPALAAYNNAFGIPNVGLSQYSNNNRDGKILSFSPLNGKKTACWVPESFYKSKTYADSQRCITYANVNCENPYRLWAENVVYCMFGGMSEFPEAIGIPIGDYYGCGPFGTSNSVNIGASADKPVPQFMPGNNQGTCSDDWFTQCTYFGTQFGGSHGSDYPFQPITNSELDSINSTQNKSVTIAGLTKGNTIPKIFSNWLTLNLSCSAGMLFGGAGWLKSSPGWLIGCCLLADGGGISVTNPNNASNGKCSSSAGTYDPNSSSVWSMVTGDAINSYPNAYYVIYDLISNGGIGMPPDPTVIGGNKLFFDNKAVIMAVEYNVKYTNKNTGMMVNNGQVQDYYFVDVDPLELNNAKFWTDPYSKYYYNNANDVNKRDFNFMRLYNINKNNYREVTGDGPSGIISEIKTYDFTKNNYNNKFPYMCNKNNNLLKISESAMPQYNATNPEWFDLVINAQTGSFLNNYSMQIGNKLCNILSKIQPCKSPLQPLAKEKLMC